MKLLFVTDIHGNKDAYSKAFSLPCDALIFGGDLLPHHFHFTEFVARQREFIEGWLLPALEKPHPPIYWIMGNDDASANEDLFLDADRRGRATYLHARAAPFGDGFIAGYSCVPLTPFGIKDWDRFDTTDSPNYNDQRAYYLSSRDGLGRCDIDRDIRPRPTIAADLAALATKSDPARTTYVIHTPPRQTALDVLYNGHAIGSHAVRDFIERARPPLTLHGHIHESPDMSGKIVDTIGPTVMFNPGASLTRLRALEIDTADPLRYHRVL